MKNTLVKYNNYGSIFEKLTHDIFNDVFSDPFFATSRNWRPESTHETEKEWVFEVELPRVKKEQVKVKSINKNTIAIDVNTEKLTYQRTFHTNEIDATKADVKLEDGVLTVKLPKIKVEDNAKLLEIK